MAEITPVTREEFYLAKAGGQDVPVPSAVTRKEHYLEKLSNDSVVVPSPVTRREKFLYFACGGEIDLPSEDKMTRLEHFIAKAGGMDVSTPTALTRLEKFWANVEGGGWKAITGTLPLTFRSNGDDLFNYRIYGTEDGAGVQTENLFDVSKIQEGTSLNGGTVERNGTAITIHTSNQSNNTPDAKPSTLNDLTNGLLEIGKSYKLYITSTDTQRQYIYLYGANVAWNNRQILEITQERLNSQVRWYAPSSSSTATISDMMICKANETIDHYIPYGYKFPLTVTSGTESKDTDIYIGDSKLLSGDYVDYETGKIVRNGTPQDPPLLLPAIETFEGTNTLDSTETLGQVTIKGKIKEA